MSKTRREKGSRQTTGSAPQKRRWLGPTIILLAAVVATAPLVVHGPSCGGDFGFHFISWLDAEHSMSMGIVYPHWANSPNFEAGEPKFVFYPPLSWMGGAMLGAVLPWSWAPIVAYILLLAGTGLGTRALAREAMEDGPATLAGCTAIFFGYVLFCVYTRNDFAELMGGFWFPLLLLYALRRRNPGGSLREKIFDGSAGPLALIMAGIWLSNGPLGIMAGYLLFAVALTSTAIERSPVPLLRAAASTVAGMGLASLYLIPAVWERHWASIENAVNPANYAIENSWLFARHSDPLLAPHDFTLHMVSVVATFMLTIAFAGGAVVWMRKTMPGERRWWLPIALIPPVVLLLQLPVSQPLWNVLPELRMLQFPWRWLVVLEAPMALCFAAAVWMDGTAARRIVVPLCAVVFAGISFEAPQWWFMECGSVLFSLPDAVEQHIGVIGKPEYAPPGIRFPVVSLLVDLKGNPLLDALGNFHPEQLAPQDPNGDPHAHPNLQTVPSACLLDDAGSAESGAGDAPAWHGTAANCKSDGWNELSLISLLSSRGAPRDTPEEKWFKGVADHAGYLILRLRYYPAWGVTVNGVPVTPVAERERGLMAVPVPQGNVQVAVKWTTTGDVIAARWVSAMALLVITGVFLMEQQQWRTAVGSWVGSQISGENLEPELRQANRKQTGTPGKAGKPIRRK